MEIFIMIILILLNGVFAMSEMALVSSRKFKLENAKKKGDSNAATALELSENPTKFLSTVQIGITLIGILLGIYSGKNLTGDVAVFYSEFAWTKPYTKSLATGTVVVTVTYLSIVVGELLPKRLGMAFPETVITFLAKPMKTLSFLTSPFVWLLSSSHNLILTILGIDKITESKMSEEEIITMIAESVEGGEIEEIEQDIVERVFELGDRRINSLMTHRGDIVFFTTNDSWADIKEKINQEKHSAYPVSTSNNLDDMIGIAMIKDLFSYPTDASFDITKIIRKPIFLNENTFSYRVLETFKKEKLHYGMIVDEYGTVIGMVTMDDVVDALVGDMTELDQDEYAITRRDETSWLVDGHYSAVDFAKEFNLLDQIQDSYSTVAGMILHRLDRLPEVGEQLTIGNYLIEIMDKDGHRIDKVLVSKIPEDET